MAPTLTPQQFVDQWRYSQLNERAAYQQHFIGLCQIIGHPTPIEMDHKGEFFRFEAGASKEKGGEGFADVWYRDHFAWEYKGKHGNLEKAYQQLLQYRDDLGNPPLLIVSDTDRIVVHTNFTYTVKREITILLEDLLTVKGQAYLRDIFHDPEAFRVDRAAEDVTKEAATKFSRLAELLRDAGHEPRLVAHFLIRLLFCLFAEDTLLLPNKVLTKTAMNFRNQPSFFTQQLSTLFAAMTTGGGFGMEMIQHFDGRLFDDAQALDLGKDGIEILIEVGGLDWGNIEPAIFGTLFERSLDPSKRSQLGAHYTSKEDILLVIEPVLMAPLRRKWQEVKEQALALATSRDAETGRKRSNLQDKLSALLTGFADEVSSIQVLDPACGSGNFLYLALRQLLDLWREVTNFMSERVGLQRPTVQFGPSPKQLHGIEINEYAHQLAQTSIQIGYIQWLRENGYGHPSEPILKPLDSILNMDAILAFDDQGRPCETEWPKAEVIVGNPPFLGGKLLRTELGDEYVDSLFELFGSHIPRESDLVCYWFEKARILLERGITKRAGLLATNSIRGGANREVLSRIQQIGNIFWAQSDRDWILEGAAVNVSMVGFDDGSESEIELDGRKVTQINSDLTTSFDLTKAVPLSGNRGIAYMGVTPLGPFTISEEQALLWKKITGNPNGRPNTDVLRPFMNAMDVVRRPSKTWIIDFGIGISEEEAALYEAPFEHIKQYVKPFRASARAGDRTGVHWWLHQRPRPEMREALKGLDRYIATPGVSKHRIFVWLDKDILPDHALFVFARSDDYIFGVMHSKPHELWSLRKGTSLEDRPRYTPTTTFVTFPFPWPLGEEPANNPLLVDIANAARTLVQMRENWLTPMSVSEIEIKKRTLTNLYNLNPTWLQNIHRELDHAVFAAYGWPDNLSDEEILGRLLALNLERASKQSGEAIPLEDSDEE